MVVAAAVAAVGPMGGSSAAWKARINGVIPQVGAMLGSGSFQMSRALAILGASVFWAEFLGFETDYLTMDGKPDRSKRLQVALSHPVDKRFPDGVQHIRTERTDTEAGKAMHNRLAQIEPGDEVICWKVQEAMKSGGGETMAVLYHIETTGRRKDAADRPPPRADPVAGDAPEEATPSVSSGAHPEMEAFNLATADWDSKHKAALVRDLKFANLFPPTVDNVDLMIAFIKEWSF
jgi:hypothetical protein